MRVYRNGQGIIERHDIEYYTLYADYSVFDGKYSDLNSYLEDWEELI